MAIQFYASTFVFQFSCEGLNTVELAQLTLGAHDINPINASERIFTVACNLFGLLFGGTIIAILSNTLIDLKERNQEKASLLRVLKEFLLHNNVPLGVRMRVIQQAEERALQRAHILVEKDVKALELLSRGLLRELRNSLLQSHVLSNSLFCAWRCLSSVCIESLCGDGAEIL
eukprot:4158351-Amphidinium_carterae.1